MTREKAKEIISYHRYLVDKDKSGLLDKELEYQAIDMAIKALEQEPCEDAIRRQAVINILDDMVKDYIKENDFDKAQGVAWVKVQKLPPVTPQCKSEDVAKAFQLGLAFGFGEKYDEMDKVMEEVKKAVTPQPKTGRWIEHFDESGKWYECDQCHTDWGGPVNYCPNCGAKMEGSKR